MHSSKRSWCDHDDSASRARQAPAVREEEAVLRNRRIPVLVLAVAVVATTVGIAWAQQDGEALHRGLTP
jgi:hypothetical protein